MQSREGFNGVRLEACQTLWPQRQSWAFRTTRVQNACQALKFVFALFWTSLAVGLRCLSKTGLPSKVRHSNTNCKKWNVLFTASFCKVPSRTLAGNSRKSSESVSGVFPEFSGISSAKSQPYWGYGLRLHLHLCNSPSRLFHSALCPERVGRIPKSYPAKVNKN